MLKENNVSTVIVLIFDSYLYYQYIFAIFFFSAIIYYSVITKTYPFYKMITILRPTISYNIDHFTVNSL